MLLTDAAGVASGLYQLRFATMQLFSLLMKQPTAIARRITPEVLQRMNSAERAATIRTLMQEAEKTAEGQAAEMVGSASGSVNYMIHFIDTVIYGE